MCITAAIIGSSVLGAVSANKAARAQTTAARNQVQLAEQTRDLVRSDLQPSREAGDAARDALLFHLGLGPRPEGMTDFQGTPGFQFALDTGQRAVDASGAARGNFFSGATGEALTRLGTGLAQQDFGTHLNRLTGVANAGQSAAAGQGAAAQFSNQLSSQALGAAGNAQAAGAIGVGNAINQGIGNFIGYQQFQDLLRRT